MSKVEFRYKSNTIQVLCYQHEIMENICQRFAAKSNLDLKNLIFLYSGSKIDLKLPFSQLINNVDKERKTMLILVNSKIIENMNNNSEFIQSKFPICPKCSEKVILQIDNFKINLVGCKNGHINDNILLNEYENTQKLFFSKINCGMCKIKRSETYNNEMHICYKCKMCLCPLCKQIHIHDKNHEVINYENKNYICEIHNEFYVSYCKNCKSNICMKCEKQHLKHEIISYGSILPEKDELIKRLDNYRNKVATFNNNINQIIYKLVNIRDNVEILYNIYHDMVSQYEDHCRNYEVFMSLENIANNKINKEIEKINHIDNINSKIENLLNLYERINFFDEVVDEINIIYNSNKERKIKIFDETFVNNNKESCKIIYENEEYDLSETFEINNDINKLHIKLKGINNITNMGCMFYECKSLESLPDIYKWNTNKIKNMNYLFFRCYSLKSLPDISKWNTSNVINMKYMFSECKYLESLPDISKWNTNQVTDMSFMFDECSSLQSLPDISKWNVSNATNMKSMFSGCSSLKSLPDLSKWNTSNINNMKCMFQGCKILEALPDISKWNTSNVNDMRSMFFNCEKIIAIPDISNWNLKKVVDISHMFSGCSSLKLVPKFLKWNTNKIIDMSFLFSKCSSLKSLPDISKWDTSNVKNIESMFEKCKSLENLPNISNWDTSNINKMNHLFFGCSSLKSLPDISKWNTSNVINMKCLFSECKLLKFLPNISKWNTNQVTDMSYMFDECSSLQSLPDISIWNLDKLIGKKNMFSGCSQDISIPEKFK